MSPSVGTQPWLVTQTSITESSNEISRNSSSSVVSTSDRFPNGSPSLTSVNSDGVTQSPFLESTTAVSSSISRESSRRSSSDESGLKPSSEASNSTSRGLPFTHFSGSELSTAWLPKTGNSILPGMSSSEVPPTSLPKQSRPSPVPGFPPSTTKSPITLMFGPGTSTGSFDTETPIHPHLDSSTASPGSLPRCPEPSSFGGIAILTTTFLFDCTSATFPLGRPAPTITTPIWPFFSTDSGNVVTKMPTGWSTELIKGSKITANTWTTTTTTENGERKEIILPLIWCSDCGGGSIMIWIPKFPDWIKIDINVLPKISFKIPGIPTFHFPCILIPVLHPCSSPPGGDKDGKKNKDDKPEPSNSPTKSSTTESKSTSNTESSSSSTESCSSGKMTAQSCGRTCLDYSASSGT